MNSEERTTISLADLRGLLKACLEAGYIDEYALHRIMDFAKE